MEYRIEHDSMGEVRVPADRLYGAQTARSLENFKIGQDRMPAAVIRAFALLKRAAATVNSRYRPSKMTEEKCAAITRVCDEIAAGELHEEFPLVVFQTGSGTQTNMNVNEVIAGRAAALAGCPLLHPNDDVNMSQSSNDTFPTAMRLAAVSETEARLLPALDEMIAALLLLEEENRGIVKSGRTHLQDATPIAFSQEISGWRASLTHDREAIAASLAALSQLAIGGTAVGTGLNAPRGFGEAVAVELTALTGHPYRADGNKFSALTSLAPFVTGHAALRALACDLMKMANDIRWMASGPRCGLGEITIPANEPGSSIMPGKVNPTQCEQVTMVAVQVMGNDTAVGIAASQGNFELNVFLPVIAYNFLQSVRLMSESIRAFTEHCVRGIKADREKMRRNLAASLMTVTALNPTIGYENAAKCAQLAFAEGISLKEACVKLGLLTPERFDELFHPEEMI